MNKLLIGAFALAAISTGALAAAGDHGGNGKDRQTYISTSNTNALEVAPSVSKDGQIENYLNKRQLR